MPLESNINFQIIGSDDVTTDPTVTFTCSINDNESIFVGSDSIDSVGHVWQYKNQSWNRITDNLESQGLLSINSLALKENILYAGTGGKYFDYGKGQVWRNYGKGGWENTNLQFPQNGNILIRNLLKVGDDIFAAGTAAYAYKLVNNQWNQVFVGSISAFNFIDSTTDGVNIFASLNGIDSFQYSGILKYDGNSWNQISLPGFGRSNNYLITKLAYYNNKLFAGTFNEISGCEVWMYDNVSWSNIASGGLGSKNNFRVVDIKHDTSNLLVSLENPTGGQVWAYTESGGWSSCSINSPVKYNSYLIETFNDNYYLIGKQRINILPDVSTIIKYTAADRIASGLTFYPDGSFSQTPIGNGRYRFVGANAYRFAVTEGTLEDPIQLVLSPTGATEAYTDLYNYLGLTGVAPIRFQEVLEQKPDAVSGQLGMVFEINQSEGWEPENLSGIAYFGAGVNHLNEQEGILLHFYHTEEGYWNLPEILPGIRPPGGWESDIRQAVSFDNGITFYDCGSIIKSYFSASPTGPLLQGQGETFAGVRKIGDYLYGYYWNDIQGPDILADTKVLCVARAPYDEVIQYALNKQVSPNWKKYYNGSFNQPSQKGLASDLIKTYLVPIRRHSATFYSSALEKTFTFITNPLTVFDSNLYSYRPGNNANVHVITSDDGLTFGYPQRLDIMPGFYNYISVIGSSVEKGLIPDKFYIYGTYLSGAVGWNNVSITKLDVSALPEVNINRTYSVTNYVPKNIFNFKLFFKSSDSWDEVIPYTKINNSWKLAYPFLKTSGDWSESYPIKKGREEVDLYFYIGDSLAADVSGLASEFLLSNDYSGLATSVSGCYMFRTVECPQTTGEFGPFTGYRFEEIRTGVNTSPVDPTNFGRAGADIVLFHKLRQQSQNDVYIIKFGLGGSKFTRDIGYFDWSPRSQNEDFGDLFKSYINFLVIPALAVLKDSGKNPIFKGGIITLGTNYPSYISKQEFTKEEINLDSSGIVSGLISSFKSNNINTDIAKIVWIFPDRVRLGAYADTLEDPFKSDYLEYFNAVASSISNLSSIFTFASGYDPSAWASLSNTGDYGHPSTSGHIKIGETVFNKFFHTGI